MSINDPIEIAYSPKYEKYILLRGRETFYVSCKHDKEQDHWKVQCWECDHLDELILWDTPEEARQWAIEELGEDPYSPSGSIADKLKQAGQLSLRLDE